jgi:hypothetical protein
MSARRRLLAGVYRQEAAFPLWMVAAVLHEGAWVMQTIERELDRATLELHGFVTRIAGEQRR